MKKNKINSLLLMTCLLLHVGCAKGRVDIKPNVLFIMVDDLFNNFNVYLAVNDILGYTNLAKAHSASLQLGMQFVFKDL